MKQILIFFILISASYQLSSQKLPEFINSKIEFCDANLSDEQVLELREELNNLENYFIAKGLLKDTSGESYMAVYHRMANLDELNFQLDTSFNLLDTLEFQVYTGCFYKVLSTKQISQITPRHEKAASRISVRKEGLISPGTVAKRIIDNLDAKDFDLEFFKVSSLLAFYRNAYPMPSVEVWKIKRPDTTQVNKLDLETVDLIINENSKLEMHGDPVSFEEARKIIYKFLSTEPDKKGIMIFPSKLASLEVYLEVMELLHTTYDTLIKDFGDMPKNMIFRPPN